MADSTSPSVSTTPVYTEKLWPSWWLWIIVLGTGGAGFVALAPVSIATAVVAGIVAAVVFGVLLLLGTPAIVVTDRTLQVGRATIDRAYIGEVTSHRGDDAVFQRGRGLNATAYLCIRGWIDPVVRIEITDERDATPYWLTSTRRPEELAAALGGNG